MSAAPQSSKAALWVAGFVCLAAVAGLIWILFAGMRMKPVEATLKPKGPLYAQDPSSGSPLELGSTDIAGSPIKPAGQDPVLLVTLPGCSDCTLGDFDPAKVDTNRYSEIILLSSGRVFLNTLSTKLKGGKWRFLPDDNGKTALKLNSFFTPRAYALTSDLKVTAVQQAGEDINGFVKKHGRP